MKVVIAGGHGQIARHLIGLLAQRGDAPIALVRNHAHVADIEAWGGTAVVVDLEQADVEHVTETLRDADAAVFAAGAGPGSGTARKDTVDRAAAVLFADAAGRAGVRRFVQISAFGAGMPVAPDADESWAAYITAKTAAEDDLRNRSGLDWTILRPGMLTDDAPTGLVRLAADSIPRGKVSRADVAAVIVALLDVPATPGATLWLTEGDVPIATAVAAL